MQKVASSAVKPMFLALAILICGVDSSALVPGVGTYSGNPLVVSTTCAYDNPGDGFSFDVVTAKRGYLEIDNGVSVIRWNLNSRGKYSLGKTEQRTSCDGACVCTIQSSWRLTPLTKKRLRYRKRFNITCPDRSSCLVVFRGLFKRP